MTEYIRPQRLHYSAGFAFHDADGLTKSVYVLDRTGPSEYTQKEIDIMGAVQPHLDNLHRNSMLLSSTGISNGEARKVLTAREAQIAGLLCRGMTPVKIGRALSLSLPTVYRHIANIHAKLNVSNRQELLLRLMGVWIRRGLRESGRSARLYESVEARPVHASKLLPRVVTSGSSIWRRRPRRRLRRACSR